MSRKNNFGNKRKNKQVKALSSQVLPTKDLIDSCSFNFFFLTEDHSVEESTIAYWEKEGLFSKHLAKLQDYSKRSLKGMMYDKGMQGMFKPLRDKIQTAIDQVAAENGYAFIFDYSTGFVLYADSSTDVSNLVRAKLGM